jgi:hypothetical protein
VSPNTDEDAESKTEAELLEQAASYQFCFKRSFWSCRHAPLHSPGINF